MPICSLAKVILYMQPIVRKDGVNMKLQAKEGYKITDKNRSFFNDFIYVPDN